MNNIKVPKLSDEYRKIMDSQIALNYDIIRLCDLFSPLNRRISLKLNDIWIKHRESPTPEEMGFYE